MYRASAEVLIEAAQIGSGGPLSSPDAVRQRVTALLRQFVVRCRELQIPDNDTAEARYALVAFIDEQVLKSNWPGRAEWMSNPLQLQFFREATAGENFFARARVVNERAPSPWAIEVYYLCLILGFVGAPPGGGGSRAARAYADALRPRVVEGLHPLRIAPNAIPADRRPAGAKSFSVALAAGLACGVLCLVTLVALHVMVGRAIQRAGDELTTPAPAPGNGP